MTFLQGLVDLLEKEDTTVMGYSCGPLIDASLELLRTTADEGKKRELTARIAVLMETSERYGEAIEFISQTLQFAVSEEARVVEIDRLFVLVNVLFTRDLFSFQPPVFKYFSLAKVWKSFFANFASFPLTLLCCFR